MAPELLRGDDRYTSSVDVYAFAMLAYELVTGKVPFSELGDKITAVALGIKVTNGYRPKIPSFVPKKMRDLLERCWSGNAKDRPSFDEIFAELSSDTAYFDEAVDEDEVRDYIDTLDGGTSHAKSGSLEEEVAELKKRVQGFTASNDEFILALHALHGHEKELNGKSAANRLKVSSDQGNSYASFLLGQFYANGRHVERNFDTAIHYFERSTAQGNTYGLNEIGWCYRNGYGIEQDYSKAAEYYQKSANLGNSDALYNLGSLYVNGQGVEQDYSKAAEYYQKSANLGDSSALNSLGYLYQNGYGVEQDYSKAAEYYQKSADLGNSSALNSLGSYNQDKI